MPHAAFASCSYSYFSRIRDAGQINSFKDPQQTRIAANPDGTSREVRSLCALAR
jgi:hypothetical protein